jgi:hypothetical protein
MIDDINETSLFQNMIETTFKPDSEVESLDYEKTENTS